MILADTGRGLGLLLLLAAELFLEDRSHFLLTPQRCHQVYVGVLTLTTNVRKRRDKLAEKNCFNHVNKKVKMLIELIKMSEIQPKDDSGHQVIVGSTWGHLPADAVLLGNKVSHRVGGRKS